MLHEELVESVTNLSDSLTQPSSQEGDEHSSTLTLFEHYHRGKLALHVHASILIIGKGPIFVLKCNALGRS